MLIFKYYFWGKGVNLRICKGEMSRKIANTTANFDDGGNIETKTNVG